MVRSSYIEGTNKKAFVMSDDEGTQVMFTYARPAVYVIKNGDPIRIWDGFRITSGKQIIRFNKTLTKKVWESMEVKPSPCTGKFICEDKTNAVEANFGTKSFLIVSGETILCKSNDPAVGTVFRVNSETKFCKRYEPYINKFLGKEITQEDWDKFEVNENLKM